MNEQRPGDEEREMLRASLRGLLESNWPPERALDLAADVPALRELWRELHQLGITGLGVDPEQGGLQEILVVMEELGRAACPAPMIAAAIANIAFSGETSPALHDADHVLCIAFAAFDGDPGAGIAGFADGRLEAALAQVEDSAVADRVLVAIEDGTLAVASLATQAVEIVPTPGLSVPPLARISLRKVPVERLDSTRYSVAELNRLARLMLTARAFGAANRAFELAVEYAKMRQQFGQLIGRFQAIQHKLASCMMSLEGVRLALGNAAREFDRDSRDWQVFAAAACAFASPALRQVSLETQHTFGAIGYSEEHEAPRHFRRTHSDLLRHGGPRRACEELALHLLDRGQDLPDYDIGPEGNTFRDELRRWLAENWNEERRARFDEQPFHARHGDPDYDAALAETGWNALGWPKAFGGLEKSAFEQLVLIEEIQRAEAPRAGRGSIQAHALMQFGSPEQQAEFLPKLRSGEILFCLGYSEPNSGSDLASLKTSAVRDGDEWVINGQKIWTTHGDIADYMWLAARTDPQAKPPHAGISVFIVPMNASGLTIRPSMALYGYTFCNEFFDNVRVPASALVGELNGGWKVLTAALATERIVMGGFVALIRANFERMLSEIRSRRADGGMPMRDGAVRERIGALAAEIEVARQLVMNCVALMDAGKTPVHEAAISKAFTGELMERVGEAALDLLGAGATLHEGSEGAITDGRMEHMLRRAIMMVVGGGTAEIQRNLIAQRGLGLPR